MSKQKFKIVVISAVVLWVAAFVQIIATRVYVSQTDFTQAFARNQLTAVKTSTDSRDVKAGNDCTEGVIKGELSEEEKEQLAENLFRTMGGGQVLTSSMAYGTDYYVAYGYTSGLSETKTVNGRKINLTVAISYDETKDETNVTMGTPLINSDI